MYAMQQVGFGDYWHKNDRLKNKKRGSVTLLNNFYQAKISLYISLVVFTN